MQPIERKRYRISGHETFPCRYTWLPKAAKAVDSDETILTSSREDDAMVEFGVGKNMVRSIRYWAEAADIITPTKKGHVLSKFGRRLLLGENALDPYIEDIQTLWLIHWKLATNQSALIFAWDYLLNQYHEPELYSTPVVRAFEKAMPRLSEKEVSRGSLEQLYDVFIHSYVGTRGHKGEVKEDNLDCPLVELELLRPAGSTQSELQGGRWETKYVFRHEEKLEISQALFAFCLEEFWQNRFGSIDNKEQSMSLHSIVVGHGSPGQIFKIPEFEIISRLHGIEKVTNGHFMFEESAAIPRVVRREQTDPPSLAAVYRYREAYA